jgi:hypothetical protein
MRTRGCVSGPSEILSELADPSISKDIDPRRYQFRTFITLRTTDERYVEEVNFSIWLGTGMWKGDELIFE